MQAEIDELRTRLAAYETKLMRLEGRLERILNSRSYRFARRLAALKRRMALLIGVEAAR